MIKLHMNKILYFPILFLLGCAAKLTMGAKAQLLQELKEMEEADQIAAYIPQGKYQSYTQEQWALFKDSVFTSNKERAEQMFHKYGFLGFAQVGQEGSKRFWSIVQHSDKYPAFQKQVLLRMNKAVKANNADPQNYAYLCDRVRINAKQKQVFGTQVAYDTKVPGRAIARIGVEDSANVDSRRKAYGMVPLKAYLNEMTLNHYRMNKEVYLAKGITQPNIYP